MDFDLTQLTPRDTYKLLVSCVVPRPIAFITSVSPEGIVNAAPFSYFNIMGSDPPIVAIGAGNRAGETPKDTPRNIRTSGEFVINLVDEALGEVMNLSATDFPPEISELEALGVETLPGLRVHAPRIAASPIHLECKEVMTQLIGNTRIILGEVLHLHIRDDLVDPERLYVQTEDAHLVGRMNGRGWYTRTRDRFQLKRVNYAQWLAQQNTEDPGETA